jgi:hypothetical protein
VASIPSIRSPLETKVFEGCKLEGSETYYCFWVSSSVGDSLRVRLVGGAKYDEEGWDEVIPL